MMNSCWPITGDVIAQRIKYHPSCLAVVYNIDHRRHKRCRMLSRYHTSLKLKEIPKCQWCFDAHILQTYTTKDRYYKVLLLHRYILRTRRKAYAENARTRNTHKRQRCPFDVWKNIGPSNVFDCEYKTPCIWLIIHEFT